MNVDFGLTADDYAKFRAGFPDVFFDRLFTEGLVKVGDSLLDLGTGTGTLAHGFSSRGCRVTGIDRSGEMIQQAKELSKQSDLEIAYHVATAEETGLSDATFDIVIAGQCWHWFDRPKAAQEVRRILKSNGTVILAHFDWIPVTGNIVDLTERLINKHNTNWTYGSGTGMYPQWLRDLGEAGFVNIITFSFDVNVPYTADAWRGRIRASAGVGASLSPEAVSRFDFELKQLLEERFQVLSGRNRGAEAGSDEVLPVPHRVFAVLAQNQSE